MPLRLQTESNDSLRTQYAKARMSRDPRFDGKFFVAVKTTGIFCRPICPAKLPFEENVTYYSHAIHAMSEGYRPCFRCRPDSAPHSSAWKGVNTTIDRAMSLLTQIPLQSISVIAERLGISERYLNKLIVQALGIAPKKFQNLQRALFAKQLIQQSSLSMTDVAFSCGFQSLRQLQRAIEQTCGVTPSQLRKTLNTKQKHITVFLSYRPPYNWPYVRQFLAARAIDSMESVTDETYARWFRFEGEIGYFCATHNEKRHGFNVELSISDLSLTYKIIENIKAVLDLNADPILIKQSLLEAGLVESDLTEGLRLPSAWDVFESGCRAIVGQQVSVKAAIGQVTLLVKHLGQIDEEVKKELTGFGGETDEHYCFPTAELVASSELDFLRMPNARKEALRQFALLFLDNDKPSHNAILSIKGVGTWTLSYLQMRGERDPDIYLGGDLIVRKMAERYPINPEQAAPWRSYLTLQLWQCSESD